MYLDNIVRLQKTPKMVMYDLWYFRKGWLHADKCNCAPDLGSTPSEVKVTPKIKIAGNLIKRVEN